MKRIAECGVEAPIQACDKTLPLSHNSHAPPGLAHLHLSSARSLPLVPAVRSSLRSAWQAPDTQQEAPCMMNWQQKGEARRASPACA